MSLTKSHANNNAPGGEFSARYFVSNLGLIFLRYNFLNMLPDIQLNDVVRLRKPHPCGGYEWIITRLGADIGLECRTCGHRVLLTRRELSRRIKTILPRNPNEQPK